MSLQNSFQAGDLEEPSEDAEAGRLKRGEPPDRFLKAEAAEVRFLTSGSEK